MIDTFECLECASCASRKFRAYRTLSGRVVPIDYMDKTSVSNLYCFAFKEYIKDLEQCPKKEIIPPHNLLECEKCGMTVREEDSSFRRYDRINKKWYGICRHCRMKRSDVTI